MILHYTLECPFECISISGPTVNFKPSRKDGARSDAPQVGGADSTVASTYFDQKIEIPEEETVSIHYYYSIVTTVINKFFFL